MAEKERERQRASEEYIYRERKTERPTETERQRQSERERARETKTVRERERKRQSDRQTDTSLSWLIPVAPAVHEVHDVSPMAAYSPRLQHTAAPAGDDFPATAPHRQHRMHAHLQGAREERERRGRGEREGSLSPASAWVA